MDLQPNGRTKLSAEQRFDLIARYQAGEGYYALAERFGVSDSAVWAILRRHSIKRDRRILSNAQCIDIAERYLHESVNDLAAEFGVSPDHIRWTANAHGVCRRSVRPLSEFSVNHSAFDEITPLSAYWAGFLMADGNVWRNRVALRLSSPDGNHVEKFKKFVESNHKITVIPAAFRHGLNMSEAYFLTFTSPRMVQRLAEFGIVPNKSLTARCSEILSGNRDFWRGVVDGDGHLSLKKNGTFTVVGSFFLMEQFSLYCRTATGVELSVKPKFRSSEVRAYHKRAEIIVDHLYRNSCESLDRKKEIAQELTRNNTNLFFPDPT